MASAEAAARQAAQAAQVADLLLERTPTLARTRLLCIDGPSGSGKTTRAARVVAEIESRGRTVALAPMDDLYDGWGGLPAAGPLLRDQVLQPLSAGRPASHPRYDWYAGQYAGRRTVPVTDVLVVEGVGSWRREHATLVTLLVWVEAPRVVRLERAVRRDGEHLEPELLRWHRDEDALHAEERTRDHADLVLEASP